MAAIRLRASVSLTQILLPFPDGGEQPLVSPPPRDSQESEVTVFLAGQVMTTRVMHGHQVGEKVLGAECQVSSCCHGKVSVCVCV